MPILGPEQKAAWDEEQAKIRQQRDNQRRAEMASITTIDQVVDKLVERVREQYYDRRRVFDATVYCTFAFFGLNLETALKMTEDQQQEATKQMGATIEARLREKYQDNSQFMLTTWICAYPDDDLLQMYVTLENVKRP